MDARRAIRQDEVDTVVEDIVTNINRNLLTWLDMNTRTTVLKYRVDAQSIDGMVRNWMFRGLKGLFASDVVARAKTRINFRVERDAVRNTISKISPIIDDRYAPPECSHMMKMVSNSLNALDYDRVAYSILRESMELSRTVHKTTEEDTTVMKVTELDMISFKSIEKVNFSSYVK